MKRKNEWNDLRYLFEIYFLNLFKANIRWKNSRPSVFRGEIAYTLYKRLVTNHRCCGSRPFSRRFRKGFLKILVLVSIFWQFFFIFSFIKKCSGPYCAADERICCNCHTVRCIAKGHAVLKWPQGTPRTPSGQPREPLGHPRGGGVGGGGLGWKGWAMPCCG